MKDDSNWSGVVYRLFVDEANRNVVFIATISGKSIASGLSNYELSGWIPSKYRPKSQMFSQGYRGYNYTFYVWYDGKIGVANHLSSTQTDVTLSAQISWNY